MVSLCQARYASCERLAIVGAENFHGLDFCVSMSQNEDWKQMFGAAPIERSTLTAAQKSKSPSPAGSVTAARSEKELSQLVMSGSSMEHLALTRSGSAGQLGMSSTATLSSGGGSVFSSTMIRSMRQPMENTQRGDLVPSLSYYWFASASLANPYCQSTWMSVCVYVCVFVRNFEIKYLGNRGS